MLGVWMALASTPSERIERVCAPVRWVGNLTTSGVALGVPDTQSRAQKTFNTLDYGCQYSVWRLLYEDEYVAWYTSQFGTPPTHDGLVPPSPKPGAVAIPPEPVTNKKAPREPS